MRTSCCCILAAILATCYAESHFVERVKQAQTFQELIDIADGEVAGQDAFVTEQVQRYNASVKDLTTKSRILRDHYDPMMDKINLLSPALWKCYPYKFYYYLARIDSNNFVARVNRKNMKKALTRKYSAQSKRLKSNAKDVKQMAQEAAKGDAKKQKRLIGRAKGMIISAHRRYYDDMPKCVDRYNEDMLNAAARKRGTITKRGKWMQKCSL